MKLGKRNLKGPVIALALFALVGYISHYVETSTSLYLPAPSFKPVGAKFKPRVPAKEEGVYAKNNVLHKAKKLFVGLVWGSESVAVGPDGSLWMLDRYGVVWRAGKRGEGDLERIAHLGAGRPLGFHFDAQGNLLVCNAGTGLQMIEKGTNRVVLLTSEAPANASSSQLVPIRYANDLAVASDGSVYFTDSTEMPPAINAAGFYDTLQSYMLAIFQGEYTGRVLQFHPKSGKTSFVAGNFYYSNGVAIAPDNSFLLVVETSALRVHKIWLKGAKAGQSEVFFSEPPGYPDGIHISEDGSVWLAIVNLAQPTMEAGIKSRFFRWLAPRIPAKYKKIRPGTAILQLDSSGSPIRYLADGDGTHLTTISALTETSEGFYFGNLAGNSVSFLSKADVPPLHAVAS